MVYRGWNQLGASLCKGEHASYTVVIGGYPQHRELKQSAKGSTTTEGFKGSLESKW